MSKTIREKIECFARTLGFCRMRVTDGSPAESDADFLREWIDSGCLAGLDYAARAPEIRLYPGNLLPGVRSIISLCLPYLTADRDAPPPDDGGHYGRISLYARGRDYHNIMAGRLKKLCSFIQAESPGITPVQVRGYSDATPLLERAFARRAGLGFTGRNSTLIVPGYGSYVFLSEILTDLDIPADPPCSGGCGNCHLCVDTCPASALVRPYVLDARKCIAYHTIENRTDPIPDDVKHAMGDRVFGCDACQEVCPFNRESDLTSESSFSPRPPVNPGGWTGLETILNIRDEEEFRGIFAGSPIRRIGLTGLQRNAMIVAGNIRASSLRPLIEKVRCRWKDVPMIQDAASYSLDLL